MIGNYVLNARWAGVRLSIVGISTFIVSLSAGCGGASDHTDSRFAPQTNDEYTEPMTNAVIGSPSGIVTIGADGGVTTGGGSSSGRIVVGGGGGVGSSSGASSGGGMSGSSSSGVGGGPTDAGT